MKWPRPTLKTRFAGWTPLKVRVTFDIAIIIVGIIIAGMILLNQSPQTSQSITAEQWVSLSTRLDVLGAKYDALEARVDVLILNATPAVQEAINEVTPKSKPNLVGTAILIFALILLVVGIAVFTVRLSSR